MSKGDNFNDRMYRGIASIWLTVLRNYTYQAYDNAKCINGKKVEKKFWPYFTSFLGARFPSAENSRYNVLNLNDSLQTMTFVSCGGSKGVGGVAFSEMYKIF